MEFRRKTLVLALAAVAIVSCGKPQYPACESDDDCKERGEVCVDKKCVECMSSDACVKKLGAGAQCVEHMCRAPVTAQCQKDGDCASGQKCNENKQCVDARVACSKDQDCKSNEECFGGFCQPKRSGDNVSAQCRDANDPSKVALQSVHFDLDQSEIRPDAQSTLEQNAQCLKHAPGQKVVVEGHCDERGTVEYNLSLGEQRSNAVVKALERMGVERKRLRILSKGKNEPLCREQAEDCWQQNRRVEFE